MAPTPCSGAGASPGPDRGEPDRVEQERGELDRGKQDRVEQDRDIDRISRRAAPAMASAPLRLAYLILAHKEPEQLVRLVESLASPGATFVIHVDLKSRGERWADAAHRLRSPRVYWARRHSCSWGDFSPVEATLSAIRTLEETEERYDFVTLLNGQDYPTCPPAELESYFNDRRGQNLMYFYRFPFPEWSWQGYHRLPVWRVPFWGRPRRLVPVQLSRWIHRRIPGGLTPCGGSQCWSLTGDSVAYIHRFAADHPRFVDYFRHVQNADELFFHTVLGNSPFAPPPGPNHPHFVRWSGAANPDVLGFDDLPLLKASGKVFARKFDTGLQPGILDRVDAQLRGRSPNALSGSLP